MGKYNDGTVATCPSCGNEMLVGNECAACRRAAAAKRKADAKKKQY